MGTYRMGIACTYFNQTASWWDLEIVLEEVSGDPDLFTWRLVDAPAFAEPSDRNGLMVIGGFVAILLASALGALVWRRRAATTRRAAAAGQHVQEESTTQHLVRKP